MKKLTLIALLLSGCATTSSVLDHPPALTLSSTQSADKLEGCISLAFSSFDGVSPVRSEDRRIIIIGDRGSTAFTVEIVYGVPNSIIVKDAYGLAKRYWDRLAQCAATGSYDGAHPL